MRGARALEALVHGGAHFHGLVLLLGGPHLPALPALCGGRLLGSLTLRVLAGRAGRRRFWKLLRGRGRLIFADDQHQGVLGAGLLVLQEVRPLEELGAALVTDVRLLASTPALVPAVPVLGALPGGRWKSKTLHQPGPCETACPPSQNFAHK